MDKLFFIVLVATVAATTVLSSPPVLITKDGETLVDFEMVGSGGGKTYFLIMRSNFTWSQAQSECSSVNMKIATFNSTAQVAAISPHASTVGYTEYYWIGARDARTHRQFSWYPAGNEVMSTLASYGAGVSEQTCLTMRVVKTNNAISSRYFYGYSCASKYWVLCEA